MTGPPTFTERDFHKASASNPYGDCIWVARRDGWVEIRDGKTTVGGHDDHRLVFAAGEFDRFLAAIHVGEIGEPVPSGR